MHPFPLGDLVLPTIFILMSGLVIAYAFTRHVAVSFGTAIVKAGLFLLYFGWVFDGSYTFDDDMRYLRIGEQLADNGIGLLSIFSHYQYIVSTVTGSNIAYYVYNATAVMLLGHGYYAPVAINVVLTFLGAGLLMKTARAGLGMSRRVGIALFVLVALSPDILAWSTIPNFKDTLVATATAAGVYAVALVDQRRFTRAVVVAIAAAIVLSMTRLYVPLMLAAAFGITLFLSRHGRRNPWLWLLAAAALLVVVRHVGHGSLMGAVHSLRANMVNPVVGVIRFMLTPIPFHTAPGYGFMDLPQMVYWALLPFMFYGMLCVWRRGTMTARFVVIYFALMIVLYGSFSTLQGARHRVQIDGLVVIFQYYGLLALFRGRFRVRRPHLLPPRPPLDLAPAGGPAVASHPDGPFDADRAKP